MNTRRGLIVLGAGSARRMAGIDKVWESLDGRPVLLHSLERFRACVHQCVVVVRTDQVPVAQEVLRDYNVRVVAGGAERQDSAFHGLQALDGVDAIGVHDAARPLATVELLETGFSLLNRFDGAVPSAPVTDTLKRVMEDGRIEATVDRTMLHAVQTPQLFRAGPLRSAYAFATRLRVTDDAESVERAGYTVTTFPGDELNFKITTSQDLERARWLLSRGGDL